MTKRKGMFVTKAIGGLLCTAGITFGLNGTVFARTDTEVDNTASFSTDVIYQIVTDRFWDGDKGNNPVGTIFDKNNMRKYHGGDWEGIEQKIFLIPIQPLERCRISKNW